MHFCSHFNQNIKRGYYYVIKSKQQNEEVE